jgi:hypothetical protein
MSSWVVENGHIDVLVAGLFEYGVIPADSDAKAWGQLLLAVNKRSFSYNYEGRYDHEVTEDYILGLGTTESPLHPVALLKAVNCYTYQSCEHSGWRDSKTFQTCEQLIAAVHARYPALGVMVPSKHGDGLTFAHYNHPVYDIAPWGFESIEQAHADQYAAISE